MKFFNVLASLCSGPSRFESHFVGNLEAMFKFFSRHGPYVYVCVGCGCSLLLIYVFSLCLRAPRKIGSSIGLPSLNKVVTYLLTYEVKLYVAYMRVLHIDRIPPMPDFAFDSNSSHVGNVDVT